MTHLPIICQKLVSAIKSSTISHFRREFPLGKMTLFADYGSLLTNCIPIREGKRAMATVLCPPMR